jgi:hypothetical protein
MNQAPQFLTTEESNDIDKALLSSSEKFLARLTISSLRLLKIIAQQLEVPLESLTHEQVVEWFEKDAQIRQQQGIDAATLKW